MRPGATCLAVASRFNSPPKSHMEERFFADAAAAKASTGDVLIYGYKD